MAHLCIIIDADINNSNNLQRLAESQEDLTIVYVFENIAQAIEKIRREAITIDIAFLASNALSIEKREVIKILKERCGFVTLYSASKNDAADAFDFELDDFLKSPVITKRFRQSIDKFMRSKKSVSSNPIADDEYFFFNNITDGATVLCFYAHIIAIQSDGNFIRIFLPFNSYLTYFTISEMEKVLSRKNYFERVHRSHIISLPHIEYVGTVGIKMKHLPQIIKVGENYRKKMNYHVESKSLQNLMKHTMCFLPVSLSLLQMTCCA
ncbi:MAG TPA: LytTR family transcriptional regulator DNA-binding domain-containing protein [Pedobacter sp.]|nr:LytTR family transcriptional regulator DNA-binding domain-containing protein [Pedobacter sp.]